MMYIQYTVKYSYNGILLILNYDILFEQCLGRVFFKFIQLTTIYMHQFEQKKRGKSVVGFSKHC
jgi:hypothetical protein